MTNYAQPISYQRVEIGAELEIGDHIHSSNCTPHVEYVFQTRYIRHNSGEVKLGGKVAKWS